MSLRLTISGVGEGRGRGVVHSLGICGTLNKEFAQMNNGLNEKHEGNIGEWVTI